LPFSLASLKSNRSKHQAVSIVSVLVQFVGLAGISLVGFAICFLFAADKYGTDTHLLYRDALATYARLAIRSLVENAGRAVALGENGLHS